MKAISRRLAASVFLAFTTAVPAQAHETSDGVRLGSVHFEVSCNPGAQKEFDLAMAYFHSFAWEHYKAPLDRAIAADPSCGMVNWLRALGSLDNPFIWPINLSPKILADGEAYLGEARKAGLKTERERDYVEALALFFKDRDKLAHPARAKAFEDAMEQVAKRYPKDTEASILYALVLSRNYDPKDKTYANQLKAAKILEPLFIAQPQHPGVAHYLVHSYDYPPIAKQGLDAARRYSKIAPDAAHALHMPSHIFTRVGYWKDSVEVNRMSADAARMSTPNKVHALDYMVYAHLQMGQDQEAKNVFAEAMKIEKPADAFPVAYGMAAMPARLALERGAWGEAAKVSLYPAAEAYPWNKHPQAEALNAYARGIGAASLKDVAAANAEVKRLQGLRDAAKALSGYWVEQVDIQAEVVRGLALVADGKASEGIEVLKAAAAREDATEKHQVTPGPLVPARELLARVVMESGKPADAMREYEAVLTREPNRYRATLGAAQAAEKAGDAAKAKEHYTRLLALADGSAARPELAAAKSYVGK